MLNISKYLTSFYEKKIIYIKGTSRKEEKKKPEQSTSKHDRRPAMKHVEAQTKTSNKMLKEKETRNKRKRKQNHKGYIRPPQEIDTPYERLHSKLARQGEPK